MELDTAGAVGDRHFMRIALALATKGMHQGAGGPFGCVIVKGGKVIGQGYNRVLETNDPTAHAEVVAIRDACAALSTFQLEECTVYSTCEPCPMCLGAIYWARPERVVFSATREDAASIGFDDAFIYEELNHPLEQRTFPTSQCVLPEILVLMQSWTEMGKTY